MSRSFRIDGMLPFRVRPLATGILLVLTLFGKPGEIVAGKKPKRILLLHSFGRDFAPFADITRKFRTGLVQRSPAPVEFFDASLMWSRPDDSENVDPLVEFLQSIYQDESPDLIVPVAGQAGQFWIENRDRIAPSAPVLLLSVEQRRSRGIAGEAGAAWVGVDFDGDQFVRNILEVLPDTRNLYLVVGASPLERFWEAAFRPKWESEFGDRLAFHWLNDRSVEEIAETVKTLPPQSAVLVGIVNQDAAGVPYVDESALELIRKGANAPVFGYLETQLGNGIVGGRLMPTTEVAEAGTTAALRILAGDAPGLLPSTSLKLRDPRYDGRELRRWNIPEERLPPDSSILFREPTFWQENRLAVLEAFLVVLPLSVLVVLLLAARRRARDIDATLSLAAEAADVGLWARAPGSETITATPRWREIFGFSGHDSIDASAVFDRIHPDDRDLVAAAVEKATLEGRPFSVDHRIILPDGTERWIASHGHSHGSSQDKVSGNGSPPPNALGTRGASKDITEQHRTARNAEAQQRELAHLSRVSTLGVLSGALAHEINQPLGSILSNAQAAEEILENPDPDLEELREILADIVSEDRRAGDVIRRLRSFLRRGEKNPQPIDVHPNIEETLRFCRSDLIEKRVTIDRSFDEGLPEVLFDPVQLQQILVNLVVNACDAMKDVFPFERVINIATWLEEGKVHITVSDRGSGLPEDDVEALFEPFHSTKEHGLGMGLAICRMLIEAHEGSLWAEKHEGKGATFHLTLPAHIEKVHE